MKPDNTCCWELPFKLLVLKLRRNIITICEFWTTIITIAKNKQNIENKTANIRKCLRKFSHIFECGAVQKLLFRGTVCHVRRTLARSAFHGFSIGFQRCKSLFSDWIPKVQKFVYLVEYCSSRKMLSNAYFLAKFRFDTAENEPVKMPSVVDNGFIADF